jgi:hypothetical protein
MANYVTTRCEVTGPASDVTAFRNRMIICDGRNQDLDSIPELYINTPDGPASLKKLLEPLFAKDARQLRFDFERIIPMPPVLNEIEESSRSELGVCLMILRGERGAAFAPIGLRDSSIAQIRADANMPDAPLHEVATAFLQKHPDYEAAARPRFRALFETGYPGWYSWKIVNWGTGKNAFSFRLVREDPLEFIFDTAWHFPWPVSDALAQEFPTLQFRCCTIEEFKHFGGQGCFNPGPGEQPYELCEGTDDLYERVRHTMPFETNDQSVVSEVVASARRFGAEA